MRVRHGTLWNGVDLAVHGKYRIFGCPFFQAFYVSHLDSRAQHSLACEQYSVHYLHLVVGVLAISEKASLLRTSRILTLTPLRRNLSWRKRSTCSRPIISTIRLSAMCLYRSISPVLPPSTVVASMCTAVSLYHSWLVS